MPEQTIVLGVSGGIAAYKACELLRLMRKAGHEVTVVPTEAALEFVGRASWQALTGRPVCTSVFEASAEVGHVHLGQTSDLVVVAPATADLLARAAAGRADDLLTATLLAARGPVLMCPAMHTEMWQHAATRANVATLRSRGVIVMEPDSGPLTGPDSGAGRLPEALDIHRVVEGLLAAPSAASAASRRDLAGRRVLVSAGGTRERLDPVRYLGNASSGLMGLGIARAAAIRGAEVTLVAAHLEHPVPSNCTVRRVASTADLAAAMAELSSESDLVVMAAAAADFTADQASTKIKKQSRDSRLTLELSQTTDVLAILVERRPAGQVIVGFAAETARDQDELLALGRAKLARKGCDLLVLNDVSGGQVFGEPTNNITVIAADHEVGQWAGDKDALSHHILDAALAVSSGVWPSDMRSSRPVGS